MSPQVSPPVFGPVRTYAFPELGIYGAFSRPALACTCPFLRRVGMPFTVSLCFQHAQSQPHLPRAATGSAPADELCEKCLPF